MFDDCEPIGSLDAARDMLPASKPHHEDRSSESAPTRQISHKYGYLR